ncbi:MAG: cell division protein FtsZ [Asgard group archaeon]|nr:cell division protein FtsZ [Asgard group archaeon]
MERQNYSRDLDSDSNLRRFVEENRKQIPKEIIKPLGKTNCYVIGVGGGGNNTINRLMSTGIKEAHCLCVNTDMQHLESVKCDSTLLIGKRSTRGLGSGGKPEKGRAAAEESYVEIQRIIADADIVFLTCGLGGGTGTGAMPIIAEIAKKSNAIVMSVVTLPFSIEGNRKETAYKGLEELREFSDTVVVIDNDRLLDLVPDLPIEEAFSVADEVLANFIYSILNTVTQPGLIAVDFADLKSIITQGGVAVCGVGESRGENRAAKAVEKALSSPLISVNYKSGTAALINVTGGSTMTLREASSVVELIQEKINPEAEIIWGTKVDHELGDVIRITVVISGVESEQIIGIKKKGQFSITPPYDVVAGGNSLSSTPGVKERENWLKKRPKLKLSNLTDDKTITDKRKPDSKSSDLLDDDESKEFWDELGISKGLE